MPTQKYICNLDAQTTLKTYRQTIRNNYNLKPDYNVNLHFGHWTLKNYGSISKRFQVNIEPQTIQKSRINPLNPKNIQFNPLNKPNSILVPKNPNITFSPPMVNYLNSSTLDSIDGNQNLIAYIDYNRPPKHEFNIHFNKQTLNL